MTFNESIIIYGTISAILTVIIIIFIFVRLYLSKIGKHPISGINTLGFKEGDKLYLDPDHPVGMTNINPLAKQIIKALEEYCYKHDPYQYGLPLNEGFEKDIWKSKESIDMLKIVSDILETNKH